MSYDNYLRFGAFFAPYNPIGQNPTVQLRRGIDLAIHLDHLGFDETWYGEHHSSGLEIIPAPDVFIAAAAEHTRRIRFGTGVVSLPYHNPLIAIDRICQLDHQTNGRIIFGTGPGKLAIDSHMLGLDPTRQRSMQGEALEAITALLRGEVVTMKTDWFDLRDAQLQLFPYNPDGLEIAAASTVSPSGSVLAGTYGLSMLSLAAGDPAGFDALDRNWEIYEKESFDHGHVPNRGRWRLVAPMFLAPTEKEAKAAVRRHVLEIAHYIEKNYGKQFPWSASPEAAIEQWAGEGLPGFGKSVIGTPDQAIAHIERLVEKSGGFGTFLINAHDIASWDDTKRSFELFAREVMPHFQGSNRGRVRSDQYMADNSSWLSTGLAAAVQKAKDDYLGEKQPN
jgi:limonene 1,2-monooxygenase